ncbi:MAG TPA: alpha-glucan family phosphorylase [Gemmataceae bacterium]|nr:alpha-glucan family phosphorylase [Gemmataceae bacterium]
MAGRTIRTFTVLPHLPGRLQALHKLAYNMWWSWNPDAIALFRRIDADLFEATDQSPVRLLSGVEQARLEQLQQDEGFLAHLDRVEEAFDNYMNAPTWFQETYGNGPSAPTGYIAYFSAEFGIHECIPVYSGGLGVLAGDHLKSASDLGIPLVGVSLMYREGYFRQYLNVDGWQQERYPENDFFNLPLIPEQTGGRGRGSGVSKGGSSPTPDLSPLTPLLVSVPFPGRDVWVQIWRIQVGRVPLYLLDANIPQNSPEDRQITGRLYGGDHEMRLRQEMILGIGGVRALRAVGKPPTVCHMNEGHSAFCSLERIRLLMEEHQVDFATAREAVQAGTCFTTHTPVPAGNDVFAPQLVEHYLGPLLSQLKIDRNDFLSLGRQNPRDPNEPFGMTVLALRLANVSNGVSKLHGQVARRMWKNIWPGLPEAEVPIIHITNGVHARSWVSLDMAQLFERYLGMEWENRPTDHSIWKRCELIPDAELWRTHERRRERLVAFARQRLRQQLKNRGAPPGEVARADEVLDPDALTIGFARRFAAYKRGTLIFRNLERLAAILNHKERPVQLIFSGKAHPRDHEGKELIAEIQHIARRPEFRRRVVFLEDYDIHIARYLIQGCDVWLNNPRRPLEASGTSGMKVCFNGGLNLSVLDGWWAEGYQQDNGWAIGAGEEYSENDRVYQDDVESRAIYDLLEQEIVPLFYARGSDGLPRGWLRMMKRCMSTLCPFFNTNRMVQEYMEKCYGPSAQRYGMLAADGLKKAAQLAQWRRRMIHDWPHIRVEAVEADTAEPLRVGGQMEVRARVHLGPISPEDVEVQLFHGLVDSFGDIPNPQTVPMSHDGRDGGTWIFKGVLPCRASGRYGFAVRVLPKHPDLANLFEPGLICWG